jgi:hypothetical protein
MVRVLVLLLLMCSPALAATAAPQEQTLYAGSTPMGSTNWVSESSNSIFVDVNFDHLGLTAPPAVLTRLMHRGSVEFMDPIANVTGFFSPRKVTKSGFRLRLKFAEGDGRNMSATTAKIGDWRVAWVAATNRHPGLLDKTPFEQRVVLFTQFVDEDPALIRLFMGQDYYPMLRNHPKPLPPKKPAGVNATTASGNKTENDEAGKQKTG